MRTPTQFTPAQIQRAVERYPSVVTGPYAGCRNVEAVLRYAIEKQGGGCGRLAENYVVTGHGGCWNAMVGCLGAGGWLVFYAGDRKGGAA